MNYNIQSFAILMQVQLRSKPETCVSLCIELGDSFLYLSLLWNFPSHSAAFGSLFSWSSSQNGVISLGYLAAYSAVIWFWTGATVQGKPREREKILRDPPHYSPTLFGL